MTVPPDTPGGAHSVRAVQFRIGGLRSEDGRIPKGFLMDIYCPVCGEPWGIDELHDVETDDGSVMSFDQARDTFMTEGCWAVFGYGRPCAPADDAMRSRAGIAGMLADLLGDDVDGIASELADAEYMGMFR